MEKVSRGNKNFWIDKVAYVLLGIILFDCMTMGGGAYAKIKGIDIRMIWFALFFLTSLPAVFRNFKKLITNIYVLCLLVWLVWIVIATVRGFRAGNDTGMIISGLIGFASFGILPGGIALLREKHRILGLMKVAVIAAVLLSVQTIVLLMMHNLDGELLNRINSRFLGLELGILSIVDVNVVRIFLRSHPLAIFGCGCAAYLAVNTASRKNAILYGLATSFVLFSMLISFTRSLYLAIIVAVVFLLAMLLWLLDKTKKRRFVKWLGTTVVLFLVVLQIFNMVFGSYFLSYGLFRSAGFDLAGTIRSKIPISLYVDLTPAPTEPTAPVETKPAVTKPKDEKPKETKPKDEKPKETKPAETQPTIDVDKISDNLRTATQQELVAKVKENPIVGYGMGAVLDVRANRDKANEYFYLDQMLKTGLIGVVLYILPMLLMLLKLLFGRKSIGQDPRVICAVWMAGLLAIAAFSAYNPYLNGSNGVVMYCGTIAVFSALAGKKQLSSEK